MNIDKPTVYVSAPNQTFIGVTDNNSIVVGTLTPTGTESRLDFGKATKANFRAIIQYFERLTVHSID